MKKMGLIILVLAMPVLMYLTGIIFIVDDAQYAVKISLGKISTIIKDQKWRVGYKIPIYHKLVRYPAKLQSHDAPPEPIVTQDKKKLIVDNFFKWKIDSVVRFRNTVGNVRTANNRLESIIHDAVKDVLGNTNLREIISDGQDSALEKSLKIADTQAHLIGVRIVDIRLKKVQLPKSNELRLFERMKSERHREAAFFRSKGKEDSIRIVSETDRQVKVIAANAYREAQEIKGEADGLAAEIYARAFSRDRDFYSFWRTLETYKKTLDTATTMVISPKSELYKYLANP
ncbi:protease modulator HflC [Fibrobacterota bacterium]